MVADVTVCVGAHRVSAPPKLVQTVVHSCTFGDVRKGGATVEINKLDLESFYFYFYCSLI